MTLEQQCVSLELSKKLKELGIKQESLFWWSGVKDRVSNHVWSEEPRYSLYYPRKLNNRNESFSAFTVAELLNILPGAIKDEHGTANLTYIRIFSTKQHLFDYTYATDNEYNDTSAIDDENEDINAANNLARLAIYLVENHLLTLQ